MVRIRVLYVSLEDWNNGVNHKRILRELFFLLGGASPPKELLLLISFLHSIPYRPKQYR